MRSIFTINSELSIKVWVYYFLREYRKGATTHTDQKFFHYAPSHTVHLHISKYFIHVYYCVHVYTIQESTIKHVLYILRSF